MFKKLKRNSVIILTVSIILLILCQLLVNYMSYRKLLYEDYISKVSAFADMHSENITTYFNSLGDNLDIFLNGCIDDVEHSDIPLNMNEKVINSMANIIRHRSTNDVGDLCIITVGGDGIVYGKRLDTDAIKASYMLNTLRLKDKCVLYAPDRAFIKNEAGKFEKRDDYLFYGKTFRNSKKEPVFYAIELIKMDSILKNISVGNYFTKNTKIYIDFGYKVYDITNNKRVADNLNTISAKDSVLNENKTFVTSKYNSEYNFAVITNTSSNDNSLFINIIKPLIVFIIIIVGIICFLCAKLIIGYILEPLENISIKMKHFK